MTSAARKIWATEVVAFLAALAAAGSIAAATQSQALNAAVFPVVRDPPESGLTIQHRPVAPVGSKTLRASALFYSGIAWISA